MVGPASFELLHFGELGALGCYNNGDLQFYCFTVHQIYALTAEKLSVGRSAVIIRHIMYHRVNCTFSMTADILLK